MYVWIYENGAKECDFSLILLSFLGRLQAM